MATREMQLISRIITSGDLNGVIDWGITSEDFLTLEGRAMFNHILGYYSMPDTSGSVIGPQLMAISYPTFVPCDDPGMTTDALCSEVRKQRFAIEGVNKLADIRAMFDTDPMAAIGMMQSEAAQMLRIGLGKDTDMSLGTAFDKELVRYEQLESGIDLSCGPWPWHIMNEATGGFQPDDYIVIYGRPKSFKSWVLSFIISWTFNQGKRSIIYTKEMTPENIFRRVIACIAQLNYDGLRMGRLMPQEKSALYAAREYMRALQASNNVYCLSGKDAPAGGDTVPWLRAKAEKFQPDYIFVDGMYLMSDVRKSRKENERVKSISRDLSDLRLDLKIPIIVTIQANRDAAKNQDANLDEIAFSDALSQDATCIMRVINEKKTPTAMLVLGGAREYALNGFRIHAVPAYEFGFHSELREKEIEKAKREDSDTEENPKAHVVRKQDKHHAAVMNFANRQMDKQFSQ
jgi:hypothetical protein